MERKHRSTTTEPARDRAGREARILDAVGAVLLRDGFRSLGINTVAREAGVDKVLIYRYFGGLPDLVRAFGARTRLWPEPTELLGPDLKAFQALPMAERYAVFFEHLVDALRARPLTIEVLAAEMVDRDLLGDILVEQREAWSAEVRKAFGGKAAMRRHDFHGLTLLLVGGAQYLLVRSRSTRAFEGIDLQSDKGWNRLKASVRKAALALFA